MTLLDQKMMRLQQQAIILQYTRTLTEDDLKHPEWYYLKGLYQSQDPMSKVIVSIQNAILTQRRMYFCLTRRSVENIVKNDKNWNKAGFDNNKYAYLIKLLTDELGILELVKKGPNKRCPDIYKVVDKDLLKYLKIDEEKQMQESLEFSSKFSKKGSSDHKTDQSADQVVSSKKIVERSIRSSLDSNNPRKTLDEETLRKYLNPLNNPKDVAHRLQIDFRIKTKIEENPEKLRNKILELSPSKEFGLSVLKDLYPEKE